MLNSLVKDKKYIQGTVLTLFLIIVIGFVYGSLMSYAKLVTYLRVLIFPLLLVAFFIVGNRKDKLYFALFLIFYALAECAFFTLEKYPFFAYYAGTPFYCLAYLSLLVFLFKKMNFKPVIKRFRIHLIILLSFGAYLFISIYSMLWPETRGFNLVYWMYDILYNTLFILVLITSFVYYLYRDTKKSLLLFLACMFIVFSELVQVAYYYIEKLEVLNKMYSIFLVMGYFFILMFILYKNKGSGLRREIDLLDD